MKMTVLIPTYRRPDDLRVCLEALKRQEKPAGQVIVTVRDSDEETQAFLQTYDPEGLPLETVSLSVPGVVAAMSAGLAKATGDIVALTDDDTAPYPDWLRRMEACFESDAKIGGVGGRDWQPSERGDKAVVGIIQWQGRVIGNHHLGAGPARDVDVLKGANCAYRREPLQQIGFESRLRGEGAQVHWELALGLAMRRAKWRLVYDPAVALDHFIARRFDADQNLRGIFNAEGIENSAYNETLIMLFYLPTLRRIAFVGWAFLIGTRGEPGVAQILRLAIGRDRYLIARIWATWNGRLAALRTFLKTGMRSQIVGEPTCTSSS